MNDLRLPWWFNLVESGIPYFLAASLSVMIMLTLGGWLNMPESVQLLKWVEALFMAMSPAVKFLAVSSVGLGSFLSTFATVSVFVRGLLYNFVKKPALDGLEISQSLLEQSKELQQAILKQGELNELFKRQVEFLKGYAKALETKIENKDDIDLFSQRKRREVIPEFELQTEESPDQEGLQDENQSEIEQDDFLNKEFMPNSEDLDEGLEINTKKSHNQASESENHPTPVIFSNHKDKQKSSQKSMYNRHHSGHSRIGKHHRRLNFRTANPKTSQHKRHK